MKKLLLSVVGALTLGTTLSAFAGPDWQAIEHARKARQMAQAERSGDAYEKLPPTAAGPQKCPREASVLPLDHGPRAQSTPYLNRLHQERYDAQMKDCSGAMPDSAANPARPGK